MDPRQRTIASFIHFIADKSIGVNGPVLENNSFDYRIAQEQCKWTHAREQQFYSLYSRQEYKCKWTRAREQQFDHRIADKSSVNGPVLEYNSFNYRIADKSSVNGPVLENNSFNYRIADKSSVN